MRVFNDFGKKVSSTGQKTLEAAKQKIEDAAIVPYEAAPLEEGKKKK